MGVHTDIDQKVLTSLLPRIVRWGVIPPRFTPELVEFRVRGLWMMKFRVRGSSFPPSLLLFFSPSSLLFFL